MICIASVAIVSIVTSNKEEATTETTTSLPVQIVTDTTAASDKAKPSQSTSTTAPAPTTATTAPSTSTQANTQDALTGDLATDILGSWKDSAGMSGFEFLEGGKVNGTLFDLAGFGVPIDGTSPGTYSLEGDVLTIKFSIYTATIKKTYRVSVSQNELSMYDLEEHETSTYMRAS